MAKDVRFNIKLNIDGKEHVVQTTASARDLGRALKAAKIPAEDLRTSLINLNQTAEAMKNLNSVAQNLQSVLQGVAGMAADQIEAETKLAVVMRERMSATDDEIKSIQDLIAAQQQIGIIGDEVQLAGAQQVATFLEEKASIETLLPAMNNLLAQQKGYSATASDAVSIGNLLGKAMQGQTGVLTKVGITFDATQEKVMKYGTESERAAMLADIVTQNVGNMNAELAKTDAGKQKQLANAIGDIKEEIGKVAQTALPYVAMAAQATMAADGAVKLATSIKGLTSVMGLANARILQTPMFLKTMGVSMVTAGVSANVARAAVIALNVAIKGLLASVGIGLAFQALSFLMDKLTGSTNDAADAMGNYEDAAVKAQKATESAQETYDSTLKSTLRDLTSKYTELSVQWKNLSTEQQKIKWIRDNKKEFDSLKISINSVADAENIFKGNTDAVVEAFRKRAEAAALTAKLTELYSKKIEIADKKQKAQQKAAVDYEKHKVKAGDFVPDYKSGFKNAAYANYDKKAGRWRFNDYGAEGYNESFVSTTKEVEECKNEESALNKEIEKTLDLMKSASSVDFVITPTGNGRSTPTNTTTPKTTKTDNSPIYKADASNLKEYRENIQALQKEQLTASKERSAEINKEISHWQELADEITNAGKEIEKPHEINVNAVELQDVEANISIVDEKLKHATATTAAELNKQRKYWQDQADAIRNAGNSIGTFVNEGATKLKDIENNITALNEQLNNADIAEAASINQQIKLWQDKADAIRNAGKAAEEQQITAEKLGEAWGAVKSVGNSIRDINSALDGSKDAWESVVTVVDSAMQLYNGLTTIIGFVQMLTAANESATAAETAKGLAAVVTTGATTSEAAATEANAIAAVPAIAANKALTASFMELAAAQYMAAHAYIPFAGFGIAAGFTASSVATVQAVGLMPFAEGGVVSGPTAALIGEYSGASNNPEVVAPLDKLRTMLNTDGQGGGNVKFEIEGRKLVGILNKEYNISKRS